MINASIALPDHLLKCKGAITDKKYRNRNKTKVKKKDSKDDDTR
jgi:hypothetical protein